MQTSVFRRVVLSLSLIFAAVPAFSCACGCGVFDVQTSDMFPTAPGTMGFVEYDFMNQNQDWAGGHHGSAADNGDKQLRTHFITAGAQHMLNRSWGFMGEVPTWRRFFKTLDGNGNVVSFNSSSIGDVRLRGVYSGFSPDMSSGVTFGAKLPTGTIRATGLDRDTQIGTGSTDLLLGAYHMGRIARTWGWFGNLLWDEPVLIAANYRPGAEMDVELGGYYDGLKVSGVKIAPMAELLASDRWRDSGLAGHWNASGYRRLLAAPGVELGIAGWRLDASVGFPLYQYTNGDQLVAPLFFRLNVGYAF